MRNWLYILVVCLAFVFSGAFTPVYASDQFHTSYLVTHTFTPTGTSQVDYQITLTNRLTSVYATTYTLTLTGEPLANVTASDAQGPLPVSLSTPQPKATSITVDLVRPSAGKGQSTTFTISYPGPSAVKSGQVWDITLGRLAQPDEVDDYQLNLIVPLSFGHPAYLSPPPSNVSESDTVRTYVFTKALVASSGLVAGFGNFRSLDFSLSYHLQNSSPHSQPATLALPPDTYLQRVFYDAIEPQPDQVAVDQDGNWLAHYSLPAKSTLSVNARGQVHLLGRPVNPSRLKPDSSQLDRYLQSTPTWPVSQSFKSLLPPSPSPRQIFDYTATTLTYDYSRINSPQTRQGATAALANPLHSLCTDFTDVFIALSRTFGHPAREVQGYALGTDPRLQPVGLLTDVLHAWPEYWDSSTGVWRQVDPTWSSTSGGANFFDSLDLSHFAFVIHGSDPASPLPAGMYKLTPTSKDVVVQVGDYQDYFFGPPQLNWQLPWQFVPLVRHPGSLVIKNPNPSAIYDLSVKLSHSNLVVDLPTTVIHTIPPYGSITLPFTISTHGLPLSPSKSLTLIVGGHTVAYNIDESRFYLWYGLILLCLIFTILGLAFLTVKAWHLYLQKHHRPNHLRRQS